MGNESLTFKGGLEASDLKELTQGKELKKAKEPKEVYIPLHQHIGSPCDPIVSVGDQVKVGQVIGESKAFVSAKVHSSVSGSVKKIEKMQTPMGIESDVVIIESDGLDEKGYGIDRTNNLEELSPEEIVQIVKDAGIAGMGGAGFPTYVKLSPSTDKKVETVLLNGSECEPYLTSDHRTMLENNPERIILGLKAAMKCVGASQGYIGIEDNKEDAIDLLKELTKDEKNIEVKSLKSKYPQGESKLLINAITGKTVPAGGRSHNVGCVVINVATSKAIADAILEGKPLYERIVTVSGNGVKNPQNLLVKIGTPFKDLLQECGGFNGQPGNIISGGPMTGSNQYSLEVPVIKTTSGIVVFNEEEIIKDKISPCIKCAKCLEVCPIRLQPLYISSHSLKGNFDKAEEYNALNCIECGACSFICPSKRPLVESIKYAKNQIKSKM